MTNIFLTRSTVELKTALMTSTPRPLTHNKQFSIYHYSLIQCPHILYITKKMNQTVFKNQKGKKILSLPENWKGKQENLHLAV